MKWDWQSHAQQVFQICAIEISERGRSGYTKRAVKVIQKELGHRPKPHSLACFLDRERDTWQPLKAMAVAAHAGVVAAEAIDVEPLEDDHPTVRTLERKLADAQVTVSTLRTKLREADRQGGLIDSLVGILQEELVPFEPLPKPKKAHTKGEPLDMVLALSDEHADHVVDPEVVWDLEDYDFDVFRTRLQRMGEVIEGMVTNHLGNYTFERLWVASLGDKLQGFIHDMKLRNHFGNDLRAVQGIIDAEADLFLKLEPLRQLWDCPPPPAFDR